MKVSIDHDREGWYYGSEGLKSDRQKTYAEIKAQAIADGHEISSGGWMRRMLMWNWHSHSLQGYPGWEIERDDAPAFTRLTHVRGKGGVESHELAVAWDDVALVDFYQRDWTDDGIPFVNKGDGYQSGWWFATIAERDRFLGFVAGRKGKP